MSKEDTKIVALLSEYDKLIDIMLKKIEKLKKENKKLRKKLKK